MSVEKHVSRDAEAESTPFHSEAEIALSVLHSAIEAVLVIDSRGRIRYCNPAVADVFGYDHAELLDQNVNMLMPEPHASQHDGYISRYLRTGNGTIIGRGREILARRKDASLFAAELSVTRTKINGVAHFVGVVRDIDERRELEEENFLSTQVTSAINRVLDKFIGASLWNQRELFDEALSNLLNLTHSTYGFIGEIKHADDGSPFLKTQAITNIAWDAETRRLYRENSRNGLEFYNLETLFGATIRSGDVIISNDPRNDPRAGGLPPGHPSLDAYLGLPIYAGSRFIGMAGIANCPEGYSEDLVDALRPLLNTLGSIIAGFKNLKHKHRVEQDLYQAQQSLRTMASQDQLTGIFNRHAFLKGADERFAAALQGQSPAAILFIDVDHFKAVNDTQGHLVGDRVLKGITDRVQQSLRRTELFGRFGGEEFVVFAGGSDMEDGLALAERVRAAVEAEEIVEGVPKVTVSIGISSIVPADGSVMKAIGRADEACYAAKAAGRNCVRCWERENVGVAAE